MTECWRNVYDSGDGAAVVGCISFDTRAEAERNAGFCLAFRIHVRLKPEGAPKRYASARERRLWEELPEIMVRTADGKVALL